MSSTVTEHLTDISAKLDFDVTFWVLKIMFAIYILIASFINKDIDYLKKHYGLFFYETMLQSFCVSIVFALVHTFRKSAEESTTTNSEAFKIFLLFFAIMTVLNILLQTSGYYTYMEGEHADHKSKEEKLRHETIKKIEIVDEDIDKLVKEIPSISLKQDSKDKLEKIISDVAGEPNRKFNGLVKSVYIFTGILIVILILKMLYISFTQREYGDLYGKEYSKIWMGLTSYD